MNDHKLPPDALIEAALLTQTEPLSEKAMRELCVPPLSQDKLIDVLSNLKARWHNRALQLVHTHEVFEAVAMAGNMTSFAKNNDVKIIRQTDHGSEIVTVDMGQADILSSPYYYLKPNDIVYVEPLKIKQWGFTTFPYSTVFSIVSLAATLYLAFRTN